jgi:hypothetical protein
VLLVALSTWAGCQHPKAVSAIPVVLPTCDDSPTDRLISTISRSDRILVVYRFPDRAPELRNFLLTISGSRVTKIVQAMSGAIVPDDGIPTAQLKSPFNWELQFYRRGKVLAVVKYLGNAFSYGGRDYFDDTGVLLGIYEDVYKGLKL